ncbi:MAG: bestrophin family ion channel [Acidobacteriaceae bacterium]|nr:bestrophin family ion channel [Acidobacteriaceae bacterium]
MIVRPKPNVLQLMFIWRQSILTQIYGQILSIFLWSLAAIGIVRHWPTVFHAWNAAPFTLLGVAISIFLGFRNSACYDRWWEARRQLGAMVGEMRSWTRIVLALPGEDVERRHRMVRGAAAFTWALMAHLRGKPMSPEVSAYVPEEWLAAETNDVPTQILEHLSLEAAAMLREDVITEVAYKLLEERLVAFAGFQVACERIRGTPTPFTYTLLVHRTAYAYCALLPFGLVTSMGWGTPLFVALVAYAFFGLDALGDELEAPFSDHPNALALSSLARTIEISLLRSIGQTQLPAPLAPTAWILE